jgi:hypothetical protein
MRASPSTRKEATKLFWSDPEALYFIQGSWLMGGGFPGITNSDLEALKCMQYLHVELNGKHPILRMAWVEGENDLEPLQFPDEATASLYAEKKVTEFWKTLRRCFPSVKVIVLSTQAIGEYEPEKVEDLIRIAEACPNGIYTRLTRYYSDTPWNVGAFTRKLFQLTRSDSQLELVDFSYTPHVVMPPTKKRSGPVGAYQRLVYEEASRKYMRNARNLLLVQATMAYHLRTLKAPCICPFPGCDEKFEQPGQWSSHYISTSSWEVHQNQPPIPPCEELRAGFARLDLRYKLMEQRHDEGLARMRAEWGREGSEQRRLAREQFLEQLRNDPLCESSITPEESIIWRDYQDEMEDDWYRWSVFT